MNNKVFETGKRFQKKLITFSSVFFVIILAYAFLYTKFLFADHPQAEKNSMLIRIIATGFFLTVLLILFGLFMRRFIKYELTEDTVRISKGKFLRVIDYSQIESVEERVKGKRIKVSHFIVLDSGAEIQINDLIEDKQGFLNELVQRVDSRNLQPGNYIYKT